MRSPVPFRSLSETSRGYEIWNTSQTSLAFGRWPDVGCPFARLRAGSERSLADVPSLGSGQAQNVVRRRLTAFLPPKQPTFPQHLFPELSLHPVAQHKPESGANPMRNARIISSFSPRPANISAHARLPASADTPEKNQTPARGLRAAQYAASPLSLPLDCCNSPWAAQCPASAPPPAPLREVTFSIFCTKLNTSPEAPQPKQ